MAERELIERIDRVIHKLVSLQGEVRGAKSDIADVEGRLADVEVTVGRLLVPFSSPSNTERRRSRSQQYYPELQELVGEGAYPDLIPFEEVEEAKREVLERELEKAEMGGGGLTSQVNPVLTDVEKQFLATIADTEASVHVSDGGTPLFEVGMVDAGDVRRTAQLIGRDMHEYPKLSKAGIPYKIYYTCIAGLGWMRIANQYIPYMYNQRRKELTQRLVKQFRYLETEPMAVARARTVEEKKAIYRQLKDLRAKGLGWKAIGIAMTAKGIPMTEMTVRRWLIEYPPP